MVLSKDLHSLDPWRGRSTEIGVKRSVNSSPTYIAQCRGCVYIPLTCLLKIEEDTFPLHMASSVTMEYSECPIRGSNF